ncbi:BEN domain-containing protein 6-like [Gymnodraco acuticeps]|uniref:BEN domain-containing protein 6-like n=1 Tax=Gymnodraco acuticeps TaxID=8218 RepID=A0A6P8VY93_GYMAC|nr:BEN domain-containing protein 6-like [Gymnodraco acuticeps]
MKLVKVAWPKGGVEGSDIQLSLAKVVKFAAQRKQLLRHRDEFVRLGSAELQSPELGRGKREPKRKLSDIEDHDEEPSLPKPPSNAAKKKKTMSSMTSSVLEQLKEKYSHSHDNSGPPEAACSHPDQECRKCKLLQQQIDILEEEKATLLASLRMNKIAGDVVAKLELLCHTPAPKLPDMTMPMRTPPSPFNRESSTLRDGDDGDASVAGSPSAKKFPIAKWQIRRCSTTSLQKFINDLLHGLYCTEYMAKHSLTGYKASKESDAGKRKDSIPQEEVAEIIAAAKQIFATKTDMEVRLAIRQKLNGAAKVVSARKVATPPDASQ